MRKKIGLLTLGIILILCGTIIILNRYANISVLGDVYLLWPAFLILLGLEFIFTKLWYDFRKRDVQLSPSGISIFLAVVILLISSAWLNLGITLPNWRFYLNGFWPEVYYSDTVEDTYTLEEQQLNEVQRIVIYNARGSVEVYPAEGSQLRMEARIRLQTNNKSEAENLIDKVITINKGKVMEITSNNPADNRSHSLQFVNMKLWIPKEMEVELSTSFGRVFVNDRLSNVTIRQKHSDIEIENIKGNVDIDTSFGNTRVIKVDGNALIRSAHGHVKAEEITGDANIENSFDDTEIRKISRNLNIKSRHGKVKASDINGDASIENEYNDVNCSNINGSLDLLAKHSSVDLEDIKGNIDAETSYNNIRLSNPSFANSEIKANTTFGSIRADDEVNLNVKENNNLEEASASNGSKEQKIQLKNQHGDIRIDLK